MTAARGVHRPALVGRADELSTLLALCASDRGAPALVLGDAGIGKTRLLDELGDRAAAAGTLVLRGHAVPGGGPFRPLAQALVRVAPPSLAGHPRLVPFRAVLARLLPAWPVPPVPVGHLVDPVVVLGEAVLELLATLGDDRRVLVLLDDLQWADRDTLALLEYLAEGLADAPTHLVLAARDDEHTPVLPNGLRAPNGLDALRRGAREIPLRRLDDPHVATLARGCAGAAVAAEVVDFLVAAVDGLPFLVEELFAGLVETGRIRRDELGWHPDGPMRVRVPGAFARLVARRLDGLSAPARDLVRTAALLGGDLDWHLLTDATGLPGDAVSSGLRAAVDAALIVTGEGDALRWRHALTRDAVLAGLAPPEREALARRSAAALTADPAALRGARLAVAAELCRRGGEPARAAQLLLLRGREHLAAGALGAAEDVLAEAAGLVDVAVDGPADVAATSGEITVERLRVLGLGARTDEAIALGDAALPGAGPPVARRIRIQLGRACVAAERWDAAGVYLDAAAPDAETGDGTGGDDPERLALAAHTALGRDDVDGALRLAADAATRGRADDRPDTVCEALEITGRVLRRSDPPASRAAFSQGEHVALERGLVPWRIRALAELGTHDIFGGLGVERLVEARRLATEAGMLGTATGLDLQIAAGTTGADGHVAALPIARRCAEQAARLHLPGPWAHATMFVARGLFWADEREQARSLLDEAVRRSPNPAPYRTASDAHTGYTAWLDHDATGGTDGLDAAVEHLRASPVSNPAPLWGHRALLATVVHAGDTGPLDELRGSDTLVQGSNRAALRYGDAVLAARAGELVRARELLAAGDAEVAGKRHERLFLHCLMIGDGGAAAPFDAPALLREGLTRWEPAGEVRLVRWCRETLRRLGAPVPRPGRDRVTVPPGLRALGVTGRELEVLRLVAAGAGNADIAARLQLSPRTVETHVGHLLAKTGATGRTRLSEWLPG